MIETVDLDNNHAVTYLNLLIDKYLEPHEGTRKPQTALSRRQRDAARYFERKCYPSATQGRNYSSNS